MVQIQFLRGEDGHVRRPKWLDRYGLSHRFAVIQDSYLEGHAEGMYFDETLWRTLLDYMTGHAEGAQLSIAETPKDVDRNEVSLSQYLSKWDRFPAPDRTPPYSAILRTGDRVALSMLSEYWVNVGGPEPYHDSYTYSLYSGCHIGEDVMAALKASPHHASWRFAPEVIQAKPIKQNVFERVWNALR